MTLILSLNSNTKLLCQNQFPKREGVLVHFLSTWHKLDLSGKRTYLISRQVFGGIFFIDSWYGRAQYTVWRRCYPGSGDPGLCQKAGWANCWEQAGSQSWSTASASVTTSRLLPWAPIVPSFRSGLWQGCVSWKESFPSQVALFSFFHVYESVYVKKKFLIKIKLNSSPGSGLPPSVYLKITWISLTKARHKPFALGTVTHEKAKPVTEMWQP